jgi:hypothetical protein
MAIGGNWLVSSEGFGEQSTSPLSDPTPDKGNQGAGKAVPAPGNVLHLPPPPCRIERARRLADARRREAAIRQAEIQRQARLLREL